VIAPLTVNDPLAPAGMDSISHVLLFNGMLLVTKVNAGGKLACIVALSIAWLVRF